MLGCPIRISPDHKLFAPPRRFSQLITSFFASESHRHPPCALINFLFEIFNSSILILFIMSKNFAPLRGFADNQASSLSAYAALSNRLIFRTVVENKGVEPLTSRMQI